MDLRHLENQVSLIPNRLLLHQKRYAVKIGLQGRITCDRRKRVFWLCWCYALADENGDAWLIARNKDVELGVVALSFVRIVTHVDVVRRSVRQEPDGENVGRRPRRDSANGRQHLILFVVLVDVGHERVVLRFHELSFRKEREIAQLT